MGGKCKKKSDETIWVIFEHCALRPASTFSNSQFLTFLVDFCAKMSNVLFCQIQLTLICQNLIFPHSEKWYFGYFAMLCTTLLRLALTWQNGLPAYTCDMLFWVFCAILS